MYYDDTWNLNGAMPLAAMQDSNSVAPPPLMCHWNNNLVLCHSSSQCVHTLARLMFSFLK